MTDLDEATIEALLRAHGFPVDDGDATPPWLGDIPENYARDVERIALDLAANPDKAIAPEAIGCSFVVMAYHFRHLLPPGAAYLLVCAGASLIKGEDEFAALRGVQPGPAGPQ